MRKEVIIDIKNANITGNSCDENIILYGDYLHEDNNYVDSAKLIIKNEENGEIKECPISVGGYNLKIFTCHITSTKKEDILLYGETGGTGGYAIAIVYKYEDGELKEIFNGEHFSEKYCCVGKYLENKKIEIVCKYYEKKYILDICNINKRYLNEIYNRDGKVITNEDPTVSYINKINLIKTLDSDLMKLELYSRIIGVNNSNTLGVIKTLISLEDEKVEILEQCAVTYGESISVLHRGIDRKEEILNQLPEDATLINLNKFGGNNGLIEIDIDGDGNNEILCGYKSKGNQYLSAFREINGILKQLDSIGGEGYDISDLVITPLKVKSTNNILVGWRIGSIWSVLDILDFKNDKFNKLLKGEKINYSKIEVIESDSRKGGEKTLALWSHEVGEAYNIQLYAFRGENFQKTFRSDRGYFEKVEDYYKDLISRTRETPQYLYYLIDAQYRAGNKREAMENVNKAIKSNKPYPSLEELKRLRKRIASMR